MRTIIKSLVAGAVVLVAAACSTSREPTAELAADLRKDLDLAKATSLELASARPTQAAVVSAVEVAPAGRTQRSDVAPRRTPRRQAPPAPTPVADPAPEPGDAAIASDLAETEAVAEEAPVEVAAASEEEAVAPAPAAGDEPEIVSGPQAIPDEEGTAPVRRPRGGIGDLGGLGGIIGVVVRGGMGGVDDCAIHPRGGGIRIGRGFPSGGTVVRTPVYGGDAGRGRISPPRSRGGMSGAPSGMGGARTRGRM